MRNSLILIACLIALTAASEAEKSETITKYCNPRKCVTCTGAICVTTCIGTDSACAECELGDCCDGTKCNACRGKRCCKDLECNRCISECFKANGFQQQHAKCFNQCAKDGLNSTNNIVLPFSRYLPSNVTTFINISNTIKNHNDITNPIYADNSRITTNQINGHGCCNVVHPEVCQEIEGERNLSCFTQSSNECSKICNQAKHIHIVETRQRNLACIKAGNPPYFYCGKYQHLDCDECYNCPSLTPEDCAASNKDCPRDCRKVVKNLNFYNKLYYGTS